MLTNGKLTFGVLFMKTRVKKGQQSSQMYLAWQNFALSRTYTTYVSFK